MNLLGWIYPPVCPFCMRVLERGKNKSGGKCPYCRPERYILEGPHCPGCWRRVSEKGTRCVFCLLEPDRIDGVSLFTYDGTIRESLHSFKYYGMRDFALRYAELLLVYHREYLETAACEGFVLVPVPVHEKRKKERGYNQAEELARSLCEVGEEKGICLKMSDCLGRTKSTTAQRRLGRRERRSNLENAFFVKNREEVPEKVLIVDDIYTTGATIEACGKAIRRIKPEAEIKYITLSLKEMKNLPI